MLWGKNWAFHVEPFESEKEIEEAILEIANTLFGKKRIYLDLKKRIGGKGKIKNITDGYLIDLTSPREPKLYVAENELARHTRNLSIHDCQNIGLSPELCQALP